MKIGFFGGCFNPPTNAHINLAKMVLKECKLDKVIFVPVGDFYDKKELASGVDRYNMLEIACKKLENIEVTDLEINIEEKLYTIDAFRLIEKEYKDDERFFIMGADNFESIVKWKKSKELLENYNYIVLGREDIDVKKYTNVQVVDNKEYSNFSSTKFRDKLKCEQKYDTNIIPREVIDYIRENNLYYFQKN